MKFRFAILACVLWSSLSSACAGVLPDDAVVDGKTIGEWTAEWNKWAYSAPTNRHPFLDRDGSWARYGQGGPVFFAPGGPANVSGPPLTLTFSVPENKYLLIPILNSEWDNIDVVPPVSVEQLRDNNAAILRDVTDLRATIDGVDIPFAQDRVSAFFDHRAISPVFSFNFTNADNIDTLLYPHPVVGLIDPIVTDGYWLMLEPLPLGVHELQTGVTLGFPSYTRSLIYKITVVPDPNQYVLPTNAMVAGKTIAEWTAEWWKWAWTTSTNQNPFFDATGEWAGVHQPDTEVFFLAGIDAISGAARRSITVPAGKYLFLPVLNAYCDNVDVAVPYTVEELRQCAAANVNATTELHASVDGVTVTNLFGHRQISPVFNFYHETADNLESWAAGHPVVGPIDPAVSDGFWLMIEPLEPGIHTLNFGGTFGEQFHFTIDITDTITVVPDPNRYVTPTNAVVGGKTIGEWTAEWWKWVAPISNNQQPLFDSNGSSAKVNQPGGDVFFVASQLGPPHCNPCNFQRAFAVPEGKHLLVPILPYFGDCVDTPPPCTAEFLRDALASVLANVAELHAKLDGIELTNLFAHRSLSPVFNIFFGDPDNLFSYNVGHAVTNLDDPMVSDGYWLMLEPLPPGRHVLRFGAAVGGLFNFASDITDTIDVVNDPNQHIVPTNAVVAGRTTEEWTAEWWEWCFSWPTNQNPLLDMDGSSATNGQPVGDVFFLASAEWRLGPATRSFTVPGGKYFFFPPMNVWSDDVLTAPPLSVDELRQQNVAHIDSITNMYATVDGIALTNLSAHRAISPVFTFFYSTPDNIESYVANEPVTGLNDPIVSDGYWIMLEPLTAGTHVITYGGAFGSPFNISLNITNTITVVGGSTNLPPPPPPPVSTNVLPVTCPVAAGANPSSIPREDFWVPDGQVNALVETNGVLYIGGVFDYLSPTSLTGGAFDQISGAPLPDFPKVNGAIKAMEPDGAGGWFVGGIFNSAGGFPVANLAHIRGDQSVDTAWTPNPNGAVLTMVATAGRLYIGGTFTFVGGQARLLLAALEPATGGVLPFRADVGTTFPKPSVTSLALSHGILYLGGYFSFITNAAGPAFEREHLGAVDAETGSVTPWRPNGYTGSQAGSRIDALAISETVLFVGGTFTSIGGGAQGSNGPPRNFIAAFDVSVPDLGSLTEWNPNADGPVTSLAVTCDTLYVGGAFTHIAGRARNRIAALDIGSGVATEWNPNANGEVLALRLYGNTIYAGGKFTEIGGEHREFLAALDTRTGRAKLWNPKADFGVSGVAVAGGTVYGGGVVAGGGKLRKNLAALDTRTGRPLDWAPEVSGETLINAFPFRGVYALAATADTLYLGGPFTQINDESRSHVGAIEISSGRPAAWNPGVIGIVESLAVSGSAVFLGGRFTQVGGLVRQNIAAVDTASGVPLDWNPGANDKVKALAACGNALFAGGLFTTMAGAPHNRLAAVDIASGLSFNWNPAMNDQVGAISPFGTEIFFGGQFSSVSAQSRNRLASLELLSGATTCWDPDARTRAGTGELSAGINAIAAAGNLLFVGGSFSQLGGQPRNNLAALSTICPGAPNSWDPNVDGPVLALAVRENAVFAAGAFQNVGGQFRPHLAVFPPEGAPRIALQPRSQQVGLGIKVVFTAEALGQGPLSFQWQFNGTNIPGATTSTLTVANARVSDSGDYTLVATNSLGLVNSRAATLTVLDPIKILSHPASQTVAPGETVTLNTVASGSPSPTYQWRLNGVNVPGAIYPTFAISNALPSNGGSYNVIVANIGGAISSDIATVIITSPALPFADDLSADDRRQGALARGAHSGSRHPTYHKGPITSASGVGSGDNRTASKEPGEPNHAGKPGGKSVWLRWIAPASGIATFSTLGSTFDTLLAVYTGTTIASLTAVAADEDRGGFLTSQTAFNAVAGTEYSIAVDGFAGASGNIVLSWSLDTSTVEFPRILNQPVSQSKFIGQDVIFELDVSSPTPEIYQWFRDCLAIVGATNRILIIANVQLADVGNYRVVVRNASTRAAESVSAALEIGPEPEVLSQDKLEDLFNPPSAQTSAKFAEAASTSSGFLLVSLGTIASQVLNNTTATTSQRETNHCGVLGGASKWLGVHATADGVMRVDTIGSAIDTVLAVYTGTDLLSIREVACDNNGAPDGIRSLVRFDAYGGTDYLLAVDSVGAKGAISLNWRFGLPPRVLSCTSNTTVRQGENFMLCARVESTPDLTYQWQLNGQAIAGATNATLTLSNVQPAQAGPYSVVTRNFVSAITNSIATMTVVVPVRLRSQLLRTNGLSVFRLTATNAQGYVVQASTNVSCVPCWLSLYTNSATSEPVDYLDWRSTNYSHRFYRVLSWP